MDAALHTIIRNALRPLSGMYLGQPRNENPFLGAISEPLAVSSKLTRSLTSRLGRQLASMARELAVVRYGVSRVPPIVFQSSVKNASRISFAGHALDTLVVTSLNEIATRQAAMQLIRMAGSSASHRIGSRPFRLEFQQRLKEISAQPRELVPWSVQVDLFVDAPGLGFCELESGGELDSSNVKSQPEKLVLAGLASGDPQAALHFCLAYANRGDGRPIRGGLPKYLAYAGASDTGDGLIVGRAWWELLLPEGVAFEQFLDAFRQEASILDIVPRELANRT